MREKIHENKAKRSDETEPSDLSQLLATPARFLQISIPYSYIISASSNETQYTARDKCLPDFFSFQKTI